VGLLTRLDRFLVKFEEVLLALLLVSLIVLAALQVLLRNIWSTSIDWADVTLQNATVLIGLIGAAVATSEGRHLNIDLVGRALKGRKRLALNVLIGVFGVITCALLTRGGWQTFRANYEPWLANVPEGWSAMRLLQQELGEGSFPQWLSQLMLPMGFGLIGVHFFLRLARDLTLLASGEEGDDNRDEGDRFLDRIMASAEEDEPRVHEVEEGKPADVLAAEPEAEPEAQRSQLDDDDDEQEEAPTTPITPKHRKQLANELPALAAAKVSGEASAETSGELDEATVSDALSDTLVPELKNRKEPEEDAQTLFDPDLQDKLTTPSKDEDEDKTRDAKVVISSSVPEESDGDDVAEAATELALVPNDDDDETRR